MKKVLLSLILAFIMIFTAVPFSAAQPSGEPWNDDDPINIIGVEFSINEEDGSVTVSWEEDMADYYEITLVKLGSDGKYSPVKSPKTTDPDTLSTVFTSDYFEGHTNIDNEYKFCVRAVTEDDGDFYYAYGETYEFEYGDFAETPVLTVNVTSFLEESDPVTVTVRETEMDDAVFTQTVYGNDAECVFNSLSEGTLTVTVSKNNHVTREYISDFTGNLTLDVLILPLGDLNGDGEISTLDYAAVNAHAKGARLITDPYLLTVADVVEDGDVTTLDAARINAAAKGVRPLW